MRQHLAAVLAVAALVALAASVGARLGPGPAAVAASTDAKSEATALVNDVRDALDDIAARAASASADIGRLSVSGSSAKSRDALEDEMRAIARATEALDAKLRALDLRVSSLVAPTSTKVAAASGAASPTVVTGSPSGSLTVACDVSDRTVGEGKTVTYTALVSGGVAPYSYTWSGSFSGNSPTQRATLLDPGAYKESVSVKDKKGKTAKDDCPKVEADRRFADGIDDDGAERAKSASISLVAPASGAKLKVGTTTPITWKTSGLVSTDRLDVYLSGGANGVTYHIASSVEKGADGRGTYVWPSAGTVANAFVPYGEYRLSVCTTDDEICAATKVTISRP